MAFHRTDNTLLSLFASFLNQLGLEEAPKHDRQQDDHQGAADKLADDKLPAQQEGHDDAELEDQVGRSELKSHRGGEVSPAAKERSGKSNGSVRTGRRGRSKAGSSQQRLR